MARKRKKKRDTIPIPKTADTHEAIDVSIHDADHRAAEFEQRSGAHNFAAREGVQGLAEQHTQTVFLRWRSQRLRYLPLWSYLDRLYVGKQPEVRFLRKHGNQVNVPLPFQFVETVAPRFLQALVGPDRWFDVLPQEEGDKKGAELLRELMKWTSNEWEWKNTLFDSIKAACIYGFSVVAIEWDWCERYERHDIGKKEDVKDGSGLVTDRKLRRTGSELKRRIYEGVKLRSLDPRDFFMDIWENNPRKAIQGCGETYQITLEELREGERRGLYHDVERVMTKPGTPTHSGLDDNVMAAWDRDWYEQSFIQERNEINDVTHWVPWTLTQEEDKAPALSWTVHRFVGPFNLHGDGDGTTQECIIEMIGPYCINARPIPNDHGERPYAMIRINPRPRFYPGFGVLQQNISQFTEYNEFENLRLDAAALDCRPMLLVDKSARIPGKSVQFAPGNIIRTHNINGLQWLPKSNSMDFADAAQNRIIDHIRESIGITPTIAGYHQEGVRTGFETSVLQQEANIRFSVGIQIAEEEFIKPIIRQAGKLIQQFMDTQQRVRILGPDGYRFEEVSPEDIAGGYDFPVFGAQQTANQSLRVQQAQNFSAMISQMIQAWPMMQQFGINPMELLRTVAELQDIPNRDKILPPADDDEPLSPWEEVQIIIHGGKYKPRPSEQHTAFLLYYQSVYDELMANDEISPEAKAEFVRQVHERTMLAQRQMIAQMQQAGAGAPGMMQPPQQQGGPPSPAAGGGGPPPGPPGAQENPRSAEGMIRSQGQQAFANPMASGQHEGLR